MMGTEFSQRISGIKSNRFWLIVLGGIVLVSVIATLLLRQAFAVHAPAGLAHIYQNGSLTETVNLVEVSEPYTINIIGGTGFNVIEAERGRIRMLEANCPDGICVRQGWVSGGMIPIVCLPHRVVITLEGVDTDIDAVVG